jgi:NAD(P) transhydrogenase subunit beta
MTSLPAITTVAYLVASILFILALKGLSSPATARRGNMLGIIGMLIAVGITLAQPQVQAYGRIAIFAAMGGIVGGVVAKKVPMTAMPETVGLFNSFVGLAAALVSLGAFHKGAHTGTIGSIEIFLGVVIGMVTWTGSVVAFLKLNGRVSGAPITWPGRHALNVLIGIATLALGAWFVVTHDAMPLYLTVVVTGLFGIVWIIAIGGADMPVVISILNSYSGWASVATGFIIGNDLLIITGSLVGASGFILSIIMGRGMNRSISSVLMGGFGEGDLEAGDAVNIQAQAAAKGVNIGDVEVAAELMRGSREVIIIPGYGLAVAQAQHPVRELTERLEAEGVRVRFAIHPVAGRMPGHMNVLLAEANIPYDQVLEMDAINSDFPETDVTLVLGANDIVNTDALDLPSSPIYGMPILEAYKSRTVMVVKRSLNPGFSGIDNPLFYRENTMMVFGDAREIVDSMVKELKGAAVA